MKPTQYLAIDTETTGLNSDLHSLLEIAAIPLNAKLQKQDVEPFHTLVRPIHGRSVDAKAIEINGHTWATQCAGPVWDKALNYRDARIEFKKYIAQHFGPDASFIVLVGWNVSFDEGFLQRLYTYSNEGVTVPTDSVLTREKWPFHWHKIDLQGICRYLDIRAGRSRRSYRLGALAEHYYATSLAKYAAHTALGDCEMQLRVLEAVEKDNEVK